jgi:Na+/H+ antiporter NhaD/arsenite permease-like protein
MLLLIVLVFVIGYAAIVLEHPLKLDKTVPAIMTGAILWAIISLGHLEVVGGENAVGTVESVLLHHIGKIAEILFFLLGAMVIVELVDLHRGFSVITNRIQTTNKVKAALASVSTITFFSLHRSG